MATTTPNEPLAVASMGAVPESTTSAADAKHSYGQILKSSALVGGSSMLNVAIGMVRTKGMAVFLGPGGFGLFGLYGSIINLTQTVVGMGVNSSGVRQIAEAVGSANTERIALTTAVLRRVSVVLGLLGAAVLLLFSKQLSSFTFGSTKHAGGVALLAVAVLFQLVSAGQVALIQGMRRIADLAKIGVLGAIYGSVISILLVYLFRERGVVPSLLAVGAITLATSWWYSRKIDVHTPTMTLLEVAQETAALLKLGFALMSSGLMMMGVAYALRVIVMRVIGYEGTGLYQSAWSLGGFYVGLILQAMGADFCPRLIASAADNCKCNRLVNEQARVGLLVAGPGTIATLTFAPVVISVLYSAKFGGAVGILRWVCLGAALQVITWPMGFIIIAKAKAGLLIVCELAWALVHVGLGWLFVNSFGLSGAGIAFFGSYVFHIILIYPIVNRLSGFRWSSENKQTGLFLLSLMAFVFCGFYLLPLVWAVCTGLLALIVSSVYSTKVLLSLVPFDRIPRRFQRLIVGFGLAPRAVTDQC